MKTENIEEVAVEDVTTNIAADLPMIDIAAITTRPNAKPPTTPELAAEMLAEAAFQIKITDDTNPGQLEHAKRLKKISGSSIKGIKDRRLEITRPLDEQKARWMEKEKELVALFSPADEHLKTQIANFEKAAEIRAEKERQAAAAEAQRRVKVISGMGFAADYQKLHDMSPDQWTLYESTHRKSFEEAEAKKAQEAEEKRQRNEEFKRLQREIQERADAERKAKEEAESKQRETERQLAELQRLSERTQQLLLNSLATPENLERAKIATDDQWANWIGLHTAPKLEIKQEEVKTLFEEAEEIRETVQAEQIAADQLEFADAHADAIAKKHADEFEFAENPNYMETTPMEHATAIIREGVEVVNAILKFVPVTHQTRVREWIKAAEQWMD